MTGKGKTISPGEVAGSHTLPAASMAMADDEKRRRDEKKIEDPILGRVVLGNYVVESKLGHGGMGSVYLLRHRELPGIHAALKVLSDDSEDGGRNMKERFRQEALVAAAVGNHRVVRPIDIGQFEDGVPYIVMEYVDGRSLSQELKSNGPMDVTTAVEVALRIADTVVIAHDKEIIHRDLKPANIMLVREGENDYVVKLLDFGIAKASGQIKVAHTAESVVMGTPGYMSPEAVAGLQVDGRTDVFALGVVLFEMITGKLPFPAPSVQDAMLNVLDKGAAPTLTESREGTDEAVASSVEEVVAQALTKDMEKRPHMADVHAHLSAIVGTLPKRDTQRLASAIMPRGGLLTPPEGSLRSTGSEHGFSPTLPAHVTTETTADLAPQKKSKLVPALLILGIVLLGSGAAYLAMSKSGDSKPSAATIAKPAEPEPATVVPEETAAAAASSDGGAGVLAGEVIPEGEVADADAGAEPPAAQAEVQEDTPAVAEEPTSRKRRRRSRRSSRRRRGSTTAAEEAPAPAVAAPAPTTESAPLRRPKRKGGKWVEPTFGGTAKPSGSTSGTRTKQDLAPPEIKNSLD